MGLVGYELRKLLKSRLFLGLSLLLIAANLLTAYTIARHTPAYFYVYQQRERYQRFLEGDEAADLNGYYAMEREAQETYLRTYAVFTEEMSSRVEEMEASSIYADRERFAYRNLRKTQEDFSSFSGVRLTGGNCFGVRELAGYNGGLLFMMAFLAALTYYVLFFERDQNLTLLLKGCRRGHAPLAAAKLMAMLIAAAGYVLLQETLTILFFGWIYGYGDLGRPVQSVSIFRNCANHLTLGEALAAMAGLRVLVAFVFVGVVFCVGMLVKREPTAALVSAGILGGAYLAERTLEISGSLSIVKCVNPFYFWDMRQALGEYHNLDIFGYPVGKNDCALAAALLLAAVLPAAGVIAFSRTYQIRPESRFAGAVRWLRARTSGFARHSNILCFEFYKILIQQRKAIILVFLLVWGIYEAEGAFAPKYYASAETAAYHHYLRMVQGPVTEETFDFFEREREELEDMRRQIRELTQSGRPEAAIAAMAFQEELEMLEDGFAAALAQWNVLREKPGNIWDKYMVDELAYQEIWQDTGTDIGFWFVGASAVLCCIGGIYPMEEKRGMQSLLRTARNGREKLDRSKTCCAVILTGLVCLIVELPLFLRYGVIDGFAVGNQRLCDFSSGVFPGNCTLLGLIIAVFVLKILCFFSVCFAGLRLSRRIKSEALTLVIGIGMAAMISMILYRLGWDIEAACIRIL